MLCKLAARAWLHWGTVGSSILPTLWAADRLKIETRLNGQTVQSSNTSHFIFSIEAFVAYASDVCTLSPGDLILTGTASGAGFARKPPVFLKAGDRLEVEIEGLGVLGNPVVAELPTQ